MSGTVSLDFIGTTLRAIQADQREDRLARELLQGQIGRLETTIVNRQDLADVLRLFSRELSRTTDEMNARFDRIEQRLDALAREPGR